MKTTLFFFASILFCTAVVSAQEYFQQHVDYTIDVRLDDERHMLHGHISMVYTNHSPDALPFIWMHLWPNAYSTSKTALAKQLFRNGQYLMFYKLDRVGGGIDSLDFKVNGLPAGWEFHPEHVDIAKVNLTSPLQPGASVTIETPFRVKIPSGSLSRLGHIGQSYQITQWYPKPAVYDKDGWHEMPYLTQGEFYSEFGNFDVSITLPENYVLGATGDLVDNPSEERFLDSLATATAEIIDQYTERVSNPDYPPSSSRNKTLRFKQSNVHDFAWFTDKRWMVLRGDVTLENGDNIDTWAMFTPRNAHLWARSIEYLNDGVAHYSRYVGNYPYNHCTAVDGTISAGGGMEYPNITVIGNVSDPIMLETVIVHEVGHNWYYGILGSNERVNAWLDEGFNSYHETRYFMEKYGDQLKLGSGSFPVKLAERLDLRQYNYEVTDELAALITDRLHKAQPMQCHSADFTQMNYGTVVYKKTAHALRHLCASLGQERFDNAMRAYYREWSFKHPDPAAVRAVFERETGEDLSWFFDDVVNTTGRVNYKVTGAKKQGDAIQVKVANVGEIAAPFVIDGLKNGDVVHSQWYPAVPSWEMEPVTFNRTDVDRLVIDHGRTMLEYDRRNNNMRTGGVLRRCNRLQLRFITRVEDPHRNQLFWAPVMGWNEQNKFMLGLNLHNIPLPMRDWEFSLTPMYSFATGTGVGFARTSLYRGTMDAHLSTRSFRFSEFHENSSFVQDYLRNALEVNHRFNEMPSSGLSSVLHIDLVHFGTFSRSSTEGNGGSPSIGEHFFIPKLAYTVNKKNPFTEQTWEVASRYAISSDEAEGLYTEAWYRGQYRYNQRGNLIVWRGFVGYTTNLRNSGEGFFPLGGFGLNGRTDIFADQLFLGRGGDGWANPFSERSLTERQVTGDQGGMRIPVYANQWMASAVFEYDIPGKLPFSLFGGVMAYEAANGLVYADYSAGISSHIVRNVLSWHLPLVSRSLLEGEFKPLLLFTFEFHIDRLNPKKLIRTIGG